MKAISIPLTTFSTVIKPTGRGKEIAEQTEKTEQTEM